MCNFLLQVTTVHKFYKNSVISKVMITSKCNVKFYTFLQRFNQHLQVFPLGNDKENGSTVRAFLDYVIVVNCSVSVDYKFK